MRRAPEVADARAAGANNFDQLRLLAALLVLFSHAYALAGQAASEPIAATFRIADGGALAVSAFFAISGYLVTRSAERRSATAYLRARALRIWPALAVAVVVQSFGIGLLCTSLGWTAYLAHPATWRALVTASIVVLHPALPCVFTGNPLAGQVNGSLWTLRVELACYALPLLAALTGWLRPSVTIVACAAAFAGLAVAESWHGAAGLAQLLADPRARGALACVADFLLGACLYLLRHRVPSGRVALAAALLLLAAAPSLPRQTAAPLLALHLAWPYLVIRAGLARPVGLAAMRHLGDISYGVYLYAFPVQQAVIAACIAGSGELLALSPLALAALAVAPVLTLALLSSRLIETPALRLKRMRGETKRAPR